MLETGVKTHQFTSRRAPGLLCRKPGGLVVEVTGGTRDLDGNHHRVSTFCDLAKNAALRLAFTLAPELRPRRCAAVAVSPGWLCSEMMLGHYGVTEANRESATGEAGHSPRSSRAAEGLSPAGGLPATTVSRTWTGRRQIAGAASTRCRRPGCRPREPGTASGVPPRSVPRRRNPPVPGASRRTPNRGTNRRKPRRFAIAPRCGRPARRPRTHGFHPPAAGAR